ncbi:hypothetical protein DY000_02060837 [Brassica cretica]|uniref:Uncharacterized protein n=1 Tax=Brassica cretica TaxID=69181 RepID=A0ABQ7ATB0_BRACR|nr:hypothetical protein DY000_02060837 [Brassica cretica]
MDHIFLTVDNLVPARPLSCSSRRDKAVATNNVEIGVHRSHTRHLKYRRPRGCRPRTAAGSSVCWPPPCYSAICRCSPPCSAAVHCRPVTITGDSAKLIRIHWERDVIQEETTKIESQMMVDFLEFCYDDIDMSAHDLKSETNSLLVGENYNDPIPGPTNPGQLRPPSYSSRRDEALATNHVTIGVQKKLHAASKVSPPDPVEPTDPVESMLTALLGTNSNPSHVSPH